jgi:hypothetical protein
VFVLPDLLAPCRSCSVFLLALQVSGCEANTEACQVERVSSGLVNGHSETDYLGLSGADVGAVIALELLRVGEIRDLCTGVAVGTDLVLTAAHCLDDSVLDVGVGGRIWQRWGDEELWIRAASRQDVALARLPGLSAPAFLIPSSEPAERWSRGLVELAGAGARADGSAGTIELAVAEVLSVDERYLEVRLPQGGGPCAGDSGGPLLVRGPAGRVEVAGVLSKGDPSCNGPDYYERLDALSSWLAEHVVAADVVSAECGSLLERGRCFGSRAVWCEGDAIRAEDCASSTSCGFSPKQQGFRCVSPAHDPCNGLPDNGRCIEGAAVRCVDGHWERLDCEACGGGECVISARSGDALCTVAKASPP